MAGVGRQKGRSMKPVDTQILKTTGKGDPNERSVTTESKSELVAQLILKKKNLVLQQLNKGIFLSTTLPEQ